MKIKLLIILILLVDITDSCVMRKTYYLELTEVRKQSIPYKLGQVISFIDSTGITFDATVIEDITDWDYAEDDDVVYTQYRRVRLKSDSANFDITFSVHGSAAKGNPFSIYIDISEFSFLILHLDKNGNFFTETKFEREYQYLHKSIEINSKLYYDVIEGINCYDNGDKYSSILYNKTYGILQLENKDKVLFTINN